MQFKYTTQHNTKFLQEMQEKGTYGQQHNEVNYLQRTPVRL